MLLELLQTEADAVQLEVADADIEIGIARSMLKSRGLREENNICNSSSERNIADSDSSDTDSDPEAGMSPRNLTLKG